MKKLQPFLVIIGFFLLWEAAVDLFQIQEFVLPRPSAILLELASDPGWYAMHAYYTVGACLLGFACAVVVGIAAAVGIVYSRVLETTLFTLLVSLNSIPKIALAPLFIVWLGVGNPSRLAFTVFMSFFPIAVAFTMPRFVRRLHPG